MPATEKYAVTRLPRIEKFFTPLNIKGSPEKRPLRHRLSLRLPKDAETGFTLYNTSNCIGCHSCAMACPYGIPSFGEDGKMKKCDACIERQKAGMLPACVKVCPTGALTLLTEEEFVKRQEKERAKKAEEMLREYSKTDYR